MSYKIQFARAINKVELTDDCDAYGMTFGCDEDCPVLMRGECPCEDNKEIFPEYFKEVEK